MRIVFAGTPAVAEPTLRALAAEHDIVAVITRTDAPQGRKRVLTPSPVAVVAAELGLTIIKANRLDADVTSRIAALSPDLGVIVAYGGFVREPLLSLPRLGWVNLHFSLLPRWRGAAPVQRAVIAGDPITGAVVFQLVEAMDAGPVYGTTTVTVGAHQTAGNLLETLAIDGAALTSQVVDALAAGRAIAAEQVGEPVLAPKLTLDDARLDWERPRAEVYQRLRGVTPEPGAFTMLDGERFKIIEAEPAHHAAPLLPGRIGAHAGEIFIGTGDLPLRLIEVQPAGKKPMAAADWWRGRADQNEVIAE